MEHLKFIRFKSFLKSNCSSCSLEVGLRVDVGNEAIGSLYNVCQGIWEDYTFDNLQCKRIKGCDVRVGRCSGKTKS